MLHGLRHAHRILRPGNARIHQHRVRPQLHRNRRIGRRPHPRIENQRHACNHLPQNLDIRRVLNSQSAANRRSQRHDRARARVQQTFGKHHIIGRIRQHRESFLHQHPRRFERRLHIGIERCLIPNHFQLHPIRQSNFAPQPRRADRLIRGVASRSIGQQKIFLGIDVVQQRLFTAIQIDAPHRDRHHLRSTGFERPRVFLKRFVLPRPDNQPRPKFPPSNDQCVCHGSIVMKPKREGGWEISPRS